MPFHRELIRREFDVLHVMHFHAFGHDAKAGVAPAGILGVRRHCVRDCTEAQISRRLLVLVVRRNFLKHLVIVQPAIFCPTARARTDRGIQPGWRARGLLVRALRVSV